MKKLLGYSFGAVAVAAGMAAAAVWWLRNATNDTPEEDEGTGAGVTNKPTPIGTGVASAWDDAQSTVGDLFGGFMGSSGGTGLIDRARGACGKGIKYQLGHGNASPTDLLPSRDGLCDCSGFISWLCGWKGHWCTDWLYDDAIGKQTKAKRIPGPIAGCIGVYPGHTDSAGKHHFGHTALIVDTKTWAIIDCSKSQNGIAEHNGHYWANTANAVYFLPA